MSKTEDKTATEPIPTPETSAVSKQQQGDDEKKTDHSLEEIEKELDELRPEPPSPETKRRMYDEEKTKDRQINEEHQHQHSSSSSTSSTPETTKDKDDQPTKHDEHELVPGQSDPTVNENTKVPVLNENGGVELKPPQGSMFHKNADEKKQ